MKALLKKIQHVLRYTLYVTFCRRLAIDRELVLVESKHGKELGPNLQCLTEEMIRQGGRKVRVVLEKSKRKSASAQIGRMTEGRVVFVNPGSIRYYRLLAQAGYLMTDTSFPPLFSKREGQTVLNTWHGTPLKAMGRDDRGERHRMGNVQRNLLLADYLVFPGKFMKETMSAAYQLNDLYQGEMLCTGYPRNSGLHAPDVREEIRSALGVSGKQIFAYMPTWRGSLQEVEDSCETIKALLDLLEKQLKAEQEVWVRLHPFMRDRISYEGYQKIRPFPEQWDVYRILQATDGLITDYSSVLFDYANTGHPIYLYVYDLEEYKKTRGLYLDPAELGLPLAETAEELIGLLGQPATYGAEFLQTYCTYDQPLAAKQVLEQVFGEKKNAAVRKNKESVLLFAGDWLKNGITTAAAGILTACEGDGRRYYVTYAESRMKAMPEVLLSLPESVGFLPMCSGVMSTIGDLWYQFLYYYLHRDTTRVRRHMDQMFDRERRRLFGTLAFDHIVQYEGYGRSVTQLLAAFSGQRCIFVHNNMQRELQHKKNQDPLVLRRVYGTFEHIAVVTEDLRESAVALGAPPERIAVVQNRVDAHQVRRRGMQEVALDADTQSILTEAALKELLRSERIKFVTVGRFSAEKGHERLIRAFEKVHAHHPETVLLIIGGYGELYETTCAQAARSAAADSIVILRSLRNPMPIIKACQLFILPSYYEGQGLTLLEADMLGLPAIAARVCGPTGFMERYGGHLVEDSTEGLIAGMEAYLAGKVTPMAVDYDAYNQQALVEWESLFRRDK